MIKKYWWIILIAIVILVALFYAFGQKKEEPIVISPGAFQGPFLPAQSGACDKYFNSKDELEAKIKLIEAQIGPIMPQLPAVPTDWAIDINNKTKQSWDACGGKTFEECRRMNAIYVLAQQGWCIPENYK